VRVLITGATGLIGSAVARTARERGLEARALVRPGSRTAELEALGCTVVRGDVTSAEDLLRAAEGVDHIVHAAGLVPGGVAATLADFESVNVVGTRNVVRAARAHGVRRTVTFTTGIHRPDGSLLPPERLGEPYAATKAVAFTELQEAVAEGFDAVIVSPGATIGPAPTLARAVAPPGFNSRIVLAIRGGLDAFPAFRIPPVLAADVARATVDALELGRPGEVYMTGGESTDTVELFNLACEAAGVPHRVRALTEEELATESVRERWGSAIARVAAETLAAKRAGTDAPRPPLHPLTVERLGYTPADARTAVETTVRWLREEHLV
jgi:dihydroflavonol-4-reductase